MDESRQQRIQRMENQLIEGFYQKQQYPKKYDYTHTKNVFAIPIKQLDYATFYKQYAPNELYPERKYNQLQLKQQPQTTSQDQFSEKNTKKQHQLEYRELLQKQIEDKQNRYSKSEAKKEQYVDIFSNITPNKKSNHLTKQQYAEYLQLQMTSKNCKTQFTQLNTSNVQETPQNNNYKELKLLQQQIHQYQEQKIKNDKKYNLQQKFEQSITVNEQLKEINMTPQNYHKKKPMMQSENLDNVQRIQDQKIQMQQFLHNQINERKQKKLEEKQQKDIEDRLAEEKWRADLDKILEQQQKEDEQRREKQGKIQEENIKMHQLKQKQSRNKSTTFYEQTQQQQQQEINQELELLEQNLELEREEKEKSKIIEEQQKREQNLPQVQQLSSEDQQNQQLENLKEQMIKQTQQLQRQIHQAMNMAQIELLEGKSLLEKEIILQQNKNNKLFNEDYAISLLNKKVNKYRFELPHLLQKQLQQDHYNIKYGKKSLESNTQMIPINNKSDYKLDQILRI